MKRKCRRAVIHHHHGAGWALTLDPPSPWSWLGAYLDPPSPWGWLGAYLSYHIYGIASGSHGDNAGHWALQGSNDGVNWDDLHVVGNDSVYTAWEGEKWHDFYLNGESGYYQYIRWCIYKNAQGGSPEYNPYIKAFKVMGRLK